MLETRGRAVLSWTPAENRPKTTVGVLAPSRIQESGSRPVRRHGESLRMIVPYVFPQSTTRRR